MGEGAAVAVREVVAGERPRSLMQLVEARATKKGTHRTSSSAPSLLSACSPLYAGQELVGAKGAVWGGRRQLRAMKLPMFQSKLETPEEIAAYIAERKRKFPTKEIVTKKVRSCTSPRRVVCVSV